MKEIKRKDNGRIKIITGIRRCGKSYLLNPLFILNLDLDYIENKKYHDPCRLFEYVMDQRKDNKTYYLLLDEIQEVDHFVTGVEHGVVHVDVNDLGTRLDLPSGDVERFGVVLLVNEPQEFARAGHVASLAYVYEIVLGRDCEVLEPA